MALQKEFLSIDFNKGFYYLFEVLIMKRFRREINEKMKMMKIKLIIMMISEDNVPNLHYAMHTRVKIE
jgi:hypothetical protein